MNRSTTTFLRGARRIAAHGLACIALLLAGCGGGGGGEAAPDVPHSNPATSPGLAMEIRYVPQASGGALTIQGPAGGAISNVAVDRVQVRVAQGPVQELNAPNAATPAGMFAYRFATPAFPGDLGPEAPADQPCYTPVAVAVSVLYGASSLTRHLAFCPSVAQSWYASDVDTVASVFSLSASAPAFGEASVEPFEAPAGEQFVLAPAAEQFVFPSTTSESGTLHGNFLSHTLGSQATRHALVRARVGYREPLGALQPDVPVAGALLSAQLHQSLGTTSFGVLLDTFAQSHVAVDAATAQQALVAHPTCGLDGAISGATPATQLMRVSVGTRQPAPLGRRWNYLLQLVHPTNDVVIAQVAGSTTAAQMAWTVPGIPGARLRADVAPAEANLGVQVEVESVLASVPAGLPAFAEAVPGAAAQKQFLAVANSNRAGMPARLNFFLCR